MGKLCFVKRVWIVKRYLKGDSSAKIALAQNVHRSCVYQIIDKYKARGWDGLKDFKTGRHETVLSQNVEIIILDLRRRYEYGACRIETVLKNKGFGVSHRQIEKVLNKHDLVIPNHKKQKPRKWVRYELPNPNDLWHTDWTHDPFTGRNLTAYIDDRTRLITSVSVCKKANTTNSIATLKTGIAYYGKPKFVMTDRGSTYYTNHPKAKQKNTQFRKNLTLLGIRHYVTKKNRPQTNGKIERWFGTYKREYITGTFKGIKDFVKHYNQERPHMSLNNKTPQQTWNELKNV